MDIFIDRPLNTGAQAFQHIPMIYRNAPEEYDYITGEKWDPQQDPFLLLLPCKHIVKNSDYSLFKLKNDLKWICPNCRTPVLNIVEYPSTFEMIRLTRLNKSFSTINHLRNFTDHPTRQSMVKLHPTSQPRSSPPIRTWSFPPPPPIRRFTAPSTLPSVHEKLTPDPPSTSLHIPDPLGSELRLDKELWT